MHALVEAAYAAAPLSVQNALITLYGYYWRRQRRGGDFQEYVAGFSERDSWDTARLHDHVALHLRSLLRIAFVEVPYYRESWRAAGIALGDIDQITPQNLHLLPLTPKRALREAPEEFITDTARRQSWRLKRYKSSGSTGTPVTSICTPDDHRRFIAAREVRSFGWAGVSLRDSRAMIGGRLVVPKGMARPPYHRYNAAERQVYLSAYHISPATVPEYVAALNRHQPSLLTGYAYSTYLLGRIMLEQGRKLNYRPKAIVLSSEKLTAVMRRTLQDAFGCRAYEEYGSVENVILATECEAGNLHSNPDFGILEVVDAEGHPVGAGIEGKIVGTGLLNRTQPLIRYDIGDLGAWSSEDCPCGRRHLPRMQGVVGRLEDAVVGPDGREMVRFHGLFVDVEHLVEGQVVQVERSRFRINVVVTDGFGVEQKRLITQRLRQRMGPVDVELCLVPEIPRTERGKFRAVVSLLRCPPE